MKTLNEFLTSIFTGDLTNQTETGTLVPSSANVAQLEEMLQMGLLSGGSVSGIFAVKVGGSLVVPYSYPILTRCISLISALIAQLVTCGGLSVVDKQTGKRVPITSGQKAGRAIELLTSSPDGRLTAYQWVESTAADLLTMSNFIVRLERDSSGMVTAMYRQAMSDIRIEETKSDIVYVCRDWNGDIGTAQYLPRYDVAHSYWASMNLISNESADRRYLATPILQLLRSSLEVGLAGEKYVKDWFKGGAGQAPYAIIAKAKIADDGRKLLEDLINRRTDRTPLVLGQDTTVVPLNNIPQRKETADLRVFQMEEIARVYGLPPPLVGQNVTSWGAGIAELGRFGWRFGVRQHIDRYLSGLEQRLLEPGHAFRVNPLDITRGSPEQLGEFIAKALGSPNSAGYMTIEEAREMVGLPVDINGTIPEPPSSNSNNTEKQNNEDS